VQSTEGEGACFTIRLPVWEEVDGGPQAGAAGLAR